jgi:dTDP-4-amino-4,6-dideoxygalactose transaminase/lipopolysaccharide/colanic/teichoic acid biosynthesis glycosyltransferase
MRAKRIFDLLLVVGSLPLWGPICLLVALLVRIFLGYPVLFRQRRPGLNERIFELIKFRSMRDDRDEHGNLLPDAQRLPRFGAWLRSTSLDELPELLNVLRGDMSLVGPRPLLEKYLPRFSQEQRRRHLALPGITGWAQVNGRNALAWDEKFAWDIRYVEERTLWLDVKILAATISQVLWRHGVNAPGEATMAEFFGPATRPDPEEISVALRDETELPHNTLVMTSSSPGRIYLNPAGRTFPTWPHFDTDQISAVSDVLASGKVNYWTGNVVREFEREYAAHLGVKHTVAVFNGTIAIELILRAMDIGSGDEVIVPPRTYVATASSVLWCGARPVFADVDPISGNVTAESIRTVLSPRTKAVIVVHLAGWPCDMDPIMALAKERDLKVIEDCAQSHHATYHGRMTGSMGHAAAFSFCQDKIITTGGEGGMIATSDTILWDRIWSLKDHGKSFEAVHHRAHPPGFRWLHESVGTNARMTEMQAAIGRVALARLPKWVKQRADNAAVYADTLESLPAVRLLQPSAGFEHSYYRFYVQLDLSRLADGWDRDRIMVAIAGAGYPCFSGSCCEIYLEKTFEAVRPTVRLPMASVMSKNSLCFLTHPTLEVADCLQIALAARDMINSVSR